jgi:hypothetical protein
MLRLKHLTVLCALLAAAVARPADNPDNLIGVEGRGITAKRDSGESATVAIQIDPYVSIVVRPLEGLFARLRWINRVRVLECDELTKWRGRRCRPRPSTGRETLPASP